MTTAASVTKQIIDSYKAVLSLRQLLQDKLDALKTHNPYFNLISGDEPHPYYSLLDSGERLTVRYEQLVSAMLAIKIGAVTVQHELDSITARNIVNGSVVDADVERLRTLTIVATDELTAELLANNLVSVLLSAMWVRDFSDKKWVSKELIESYGKKMARRSWEPEYMATAKPCRLCITSLHKLIRVLRDVAVNDQLLQQTFESAIATNKWYGGQLNATLTKLMVAR